MKNVLVLFSLLPLALSASMRIADAQQAATANATAAVTLELNGPNGQHVSVNAAALQALPRQTVQVHNAHTGATESYQGVELATLLARVDAPLGAKLHGAALAMYVVAAGTDKYRVVYSLAEIDPAFHTGTVIVADREDGKPIDAKDGPLKLVNTEDKRPARWGAEPCVDPDQRGAVEDLSCRRTGSGDGYCLKRRPTPSGSRRTARVNLL